MKNRCTPTITLICLFVLLSVLPSTAQQTYVIKAEKLYTVSDGVIANGMVLVENGKIARVGRNIRIPAGAVVLEAQTVIPGLVDAHTHVGVYSLPMVEENSDGNEMTNPITPEVRALDSFNFDDPAIPVSVAAGVTTVVSRPGSGNIIGGTSVAVKLKDAHPDEMVLREVVDLKMAIEGNPIGVYGQKNQMPRTLMAVYHMAEKAFIDAQDYIKSWDEYEKKKADSEEADPPKRDLGKEYLAMALKGEIMVHMHCATASEVATCIRLADQFKLRLSLGHAYFAHLILDEIKDRTDVHFNIGPPMFFTYYADDLTFKNASAILANAGLKVSLQTDALGGAQQNLLHLAALCVRYGMNEDDALKAVTLAGAESVDLQHRIGSIEAGKDADLVMMKGKLFEITSHVDKVMIDGKIEYENPNLPNAVFGTDIGSASADLVLPVNLKESQRIAIANGTVMTVSGETITNGTVLIKDGKIERVGENLRIPRGYTTVDAAGHTVIPGLVSPRSHIGIGSNWRRQSHTNESTNPVTPQMKVLHAIEPQAPQFHYARELGLTTVQITPGNRNVIGGQGAIVKTSGQVVDKMIENDFSSMMFGLGGSTKRSSGKPMTRMGVASLMRSTLIKAQEFRDKQEKANGDDEKKPKRDLSMEPLAKVVNGEVPVIIHAERRDDILTAIRIADEFGLKIIIDGGTDAYKVADELKKRDIPVILQDLFRGTGNVEDKGFNPENPKILADAGIRITFRSSDGSWVVPGAAEAGGDLLEIASFAVKYGLNADTALRAVTLESARIIGMDDRIGSIEPGKDADLVILSGHPFRIRSIPVAVFVDGKLVYTEKDRLH